jgi:hypothetical protein
MIEKLKPLKEELPGFKYKDEEGIIHQSKTDYLATEGFGFCACGDPGDNLLYIKEILEKLDKNDWGEYEDRHYMFAVYCLDRFGLTEHGSTVRCSWLTDKGREVLEDINWCIENEPEEFE